MPPIVQLDEVFLSRLLNKDEDIKVEILNTDIDSKSLSAVLNKLTSTSNALQQELFQQVESNFDEFSSFYNTSQEIHSRIFDLVKQTDTTEKQVLNTQVNVTTTIDEYQQTLLESQDNNVKIDTLERLEQILQIIEEIQVELNECLYLEGVNHVLKLTRILKDWEGDARVMKFIQARVDYLKQEYILRLQEDIGNCIQYNLGSMRILESFGSKPVYIKDIFQSLNQLGLLAQEMAGIKRLIFKNIFTPYFENGASQLQINHVENESSGGVLQVIRMTQDDENHIDPVLMLQQIDTIMGFFFKYMFNKNTEFTLLFGNLILPELTNLMIEKGIAPSIPSTKYNLKDFNIVTQTVLSFEDKCTHHYGYQVPEAGPTTLGLYVQNIDTHYAKKRREKILQQGRAVMARRLYDSEMTMVKQEDGHTYQYFITQTPQILSVLISDTIDEATELLKSHPISASTLIQGTQDLLDMYRAIMPSYHRRHYLSGPSNSLVFRNDCLWLSNQIKSTICIKPECKQFNTLLNDLKLESERLEELGNAWYEVTMIHRIQMIQTQLDALDGFMGMSDNTKFQKECDQAISSVIDLVNSFATETKSSVDETLFLDILGRIVDTILCRLIHDIEDLQDIGAEESHVIAVTLNSLAQLVAAFDLPGKDATESFVSELVPSWEKFWLVKDILEMNMRDIMNSFRRGDLHMFEKSELVGLLCALFADTELRESNINEIKTGKQQIDRAISNTFSQPTEPSTIHSPINSFINSPISSPVNSSLNSSIHSSIHSTPTNSIHRALEYTPEDDLEVSEGGWGDDDDDDLFANEQTVSPTLKLPESSLLLDTNEVDMEDTGGWGDADEDIFDQITTEPETQKSTVTINAKIEPSDRLSATNSMNSGPPLSRALDFQAIDTEIDNELNEGEGWGWDDDDDLFKAGEDLK